MSHRQRTVRSRFFTGDSENVFRVKSCKDNAPAMEKRFCQHCRQNWFLNTAKGFSARNLARMIRFAEAFPIRRLWHRLLRNGLEPFC